MTKFSSFCAFPHHQSDHWKPRNSGGKSRRRTKAAAPSEPQTVQIRNARERSRVKAVNEAYEKLRQVVPAISNRRKRVSKVKTLRKATQYIQELLVALGLGAGFPQFEFSGHL